MFFHLTIQKDELAEAFLGRLARINGARSESALYILMQSVLKKVGDEGRKIPHFDYLARALNISLKDFVCRHTTIPFRRSIASYDEKFAHGTYKNDSMLAYSGFRQTRKGSFFCEKCVNQDLLRLGFSYWRRDHQLPGIMCCREHEEPLAYTEVKDAFFFCPSEYLESSIPISLNWAKSLHLNTYISRFVALSRILVEQEFPFEVRKIRLVLRDQAEKKEFSIKNGECERKLISDEIISKFPEDWLATVFPDLLGKPAKQKMHKSDGVVYLSTAASSVESYIIASCILFESEIDAIRAFNGTRGIEVPSLRRSVKQIDINELKAAYIGAKGRYADLQIRCIESKWNIQNQLQVLGLPNLRHGIKYDYFTAVTAFFIEGQSSQRSAELGGLEIEHFEEIIRQVGFGFSQTLQQMSFAKKSKKGVLRIRAKAPNEVITG